jgi:oxaloacetate decarboxylase alpha subunit
VKSTGRFKEAYMAKIGITETVLRDGQQSLIATRMRTDEMLPILETIDTVGYHSIEMWGGATFDASLRYLNEDPWERLRTIRKHVKNTKLQMLLRGQNLLGYKHYPDDVVDAFVKKSVENGIDVIRVFDALNDTRNLETSIKAGKSAGAHMQGAIVYTISPVHNVESYLKTAKELKDLGVDSICIKDMAGLLAPSIAYKLIKEIKDETQLPIQLHSHATTGLASMSYIKGIEAGADVVDTAISPFALGSSQPPTESIVYALRNTEFNTGLDLQLLNKIAQYFRPIREKYIKEGILNPALLMADINALVYQIPGGMLSNLISQLKQMNKLDLLEDVLNEVPKVRADLGYPPLVTPASQIVGTQAVLNVISKKRYAVVPEEVKAFVRGEYGKTPVKIKDEIRHLIIGDEPVIENRPADSLKPALKEIEKKIKPYINQDEDILTYALFPDVAINFFKSRIAQKYRLDESLIGEENGVIYYPV